jgi:WD40 repeat protein
MLPCALVRADKAGKPRTIGSHTGGIASTHFSPDGKFIATGGGDKMIRMWDVAQAKLVHEWKGPTSFTCAVRFSPDGHTLAAAGYETGAGNAIYFYDTRTGKELPTLPGHPSGGVRRLAFTPDGRQLVSGGFDGAVIVWDLAQRKEVRNIKVESGTVYDLSLSLDGKMLATAGREGLKLWDLTTGKGLPRAAMKKHNCIAVAFSPDGKLIASGDSSCVKLWEIVTGKEIQTIKGFKGELAQILFSRDGRTLYSASYDRLVRLWEARTGRLLHEAEAHNGWVWGISLSPDEKALASCSVDTKLLYWNVADLPQPTTTKTDVPLTADQADRYWKELGSLDASTAYKAICALASDPETSLPMLKDRLTSTLASGPSTTEIARLIRDLNADTYATREEATAALARAGVRAMPALQKALGNPASLEVKRRVQGLLARLDPTELPAEELIALRGVQALEYIGTREARQVLEQLSRADASARLSDEANQALTRLTSFPRKR